ncbi:uncharacterized protein LY89DRAFT_776404 [Mollisia scopiformis]|uniref:DUF7704 domain-containing protein n=1 Tax=Mollisia scopiformis TaxID=149040 RepID=A0A194XW65_MOLSC|nr:uncharacterized protein LY89DRAFT_776404 [Mollisia scopiformis]KUJ24259.1 hypothetical protein LY89DRAFT_776404 [Mollisia scopiformis]
MVAHIPLFYRIVFLYIDPLICLSGIYLMFFDHQTFVVNGTPSSLSASLSKVDPLAAHLIMNIGLYSICIFSLQVLLLHQFKDAPNGLNVKLWRILMFSILLIDVGLIYGGYSVNPKAFLDFGAWTTGDWGNNGILAALVVIRSAFILGIGGVGKNT